MHAYWKARGLTRVKFFKARADGFRTIAYTNSSWPGTGEILYKLIPVKVVGESSAKPLKLIPYKQSGGGTTDDDQVNTWSTTWRLEETSSPQ